MAQENPTNQQLARLLEQIMQELVEIKKQQKQLSTDLAKFHQDLRQ